MTARHLSPANLARGLGAAGHGAGHWWAQRVSAVALVPLTLWLAVALAGGAAATHAALLDWLSAPLNAVLMILLVIAAFHTWRWGFRPWPRITSIRAHGLPRSR